MIRDYHVAAVFVAAFTISCATHIAPYRPKKRRFNAGEFGTRIGPGSSSLYAPGARGLFEDNTASAVGDSLVVRIDERESASRDASTKLSKKNTSSSGVSAAMGLLAALKAKYPSVDPSKLFGVESDRQFQGAGNVARNGSLNATLPVRVRRELPNGDLYVEGTKVVMVGSEEHHIYLSGIVRRADISANNVVLSSRVADAEIEYTGRGDVTDQQRKGWLSRLVDTLWPF